MKNSKNQISKNFKVGAAPAEIDLLSLVSKADVFGANSMHPLALQKIQKDLEEKDKDLQRLLHLNDSQIVMSDVTGTVVAQLDAAAVVGSVGGASAGAAVTESAALATGGAAASSAAAASAVSVVTTTAVTTAASVTSLGTVAGVAGGAALAAAGGGGGGGTPDPEPAPLPPANPYPTNDSTTLNPGGGDSHAVHRLSSTLAGTTLPSGIVNKSLVIDLGVTYGPYQGTLYYTKQVGTDAPTTDVVTFRDIANVTGTDVNDQISGNSAANILDGGAGDDIIYGDGGADTLIGGTGQDWVLFKALTRSGDAGQYNDGVLVDLSAHQYRVVSWVPGFAQASGFEHVVGSDGNDELVGDANSNILDGAGGDDVLNGGGGNDQLFGGTSSTSGVGNQLTGGAGNDAFWVGYTIDPVYRASNLSGTTELDSPANLFDLTNQTGITAVQNASVIHDWENQVDLLRVSTTATAVIGALGSSSNWDGNDTVDLSVNVTNAGLIKIAAGEGVNNIYLDGGADSIWTGYQYNSDVSGQIDGHLDPVASSGTATDVIWGWDGLSASRDRLAVASGSLAVIGSLQGQADWTGNDNVDLRTYVTNAGTIVVSTEVGNNTVYGSSGEDHIYGSANGGTNQVWGGQGNDEFNVGTRRNAADGALSTVVSRDLIWDWQQGSDSVNVAAGAIAVLAGRLGQSWDTADAVSLAAGVNNSGTVVIALGALDDSIVGSSGVDHIYGGSSTSAGNLIRGGAGNDHFFVGFNYNPVTDARSELSASETAIDVIQDWQDTDNLTVGTRGQAIIGGLYGFADYTTNGWNLNNAVNVSHATNSGWIHVAMGGGTNNITSSTGQDHFHVGYTYAGTSTLSASGTAIDVIYGWDDQSSRRDILNVADGSTAVIGALLGQINWNNRSNWVAATGWSGNDTVDLRQEVTNNGLIQIAGGAGANTVYGSSGSDHYFVGYVNNADGSATGSAAATDIIYGWDAQNWSDTPMSGSWYSGTNWNGQAVADATYDRLTVAQGSTARIGSLFGDSPTDAQRWDGSEIIDLRSNVTNHNMVAADGGAIEVWGGSATDYIYGSAGRDLIYGGPGLDNLFGGLGDDVFYVGYSPSWAPYGADAGEHRIWDWQNGGVNNAEGSLSSPGDGLRIASGSFVVVQGLYGMDPTNSSRWAGNDTVDLRWDVINNGKIIVESSTGNDTIYGSSGVDYINPGAGYNTLQLNNGGADRVYLDNFLTRTQIDGFGSDDRIYLDTRLLQSFITAKGITTASGYDITASATNADSNPVNGQSYSNGSFFTSEKLYDVTYSGSLQAYNSNPKDPDFNVYGGTGDGTLKFGWTSNGAWNNEAHDGAYLNGKIAVIGAGTVSIIIGNSLAGIPFVGPILAIPFWVNGGLMLNDGINNVEAYHNPVYNGGVLDSGASVISADKTVTSAVGTWNAANFLDFYNFGSGNFAQSLEIGGQQPGYTAIPSGQPIPGSPYTLSYTYYQAPVLTGVASYLAVYNGTETFIYLVASQDSLIQNNETILIAQVNGQVTADQLLMYDGGADADYLRYFNNTIEAPNFPPNPITSATKVVATAGDNLKVLYKVSYTENSVEYVKYVDKATYDGLLTSSQAQSPAVTDLQLQGAFTNETSIQVEFTFTNPSNGNVAALRGTDKLQLYIDGTAVGSEVLATDGATTYTATVGISALSQGTHTVELKVISSQNFEALGGISFIKDTEAPNTTDNTTNLVTVTDTATSLIVASTEPGLLKLGGLTPIELSDSNNNQGTLNLSAQSTASELTLSVEDIFGQSSDLGSVWLGTNTNNTSITTSAHYIYGFDGNDSITGTYSGASDVGSIMYGGAGNDTLVDGANKNNKFVGGTGADILVLGGGSDIVQWSATVGSSSESNNSGKDYVYDYSHTDDSMVVIADNVSGFNAASNVAITQFDVNGNSWTSGTVYYTHDINDPRTSTTQPFTQLGIDLNNSGAATDSGDILVELRGAYTTADLLSSMRFDLTGTSGADSITGGANADNLNGGAGNDTLNGGGGNDLITGGTGQDLLSGGAGKDTFLFAAGDSNTNSYDSISGIGLTNGGDNSTRDTVDLAGVATIVANTAGTDGTDAGTSTVIKSHAISNGVVSFDNTDVFVSAESVALSDAVAYLQANILGTSFDHAAVAFRASDNHTYLFQNNQTGGDILIDLGSVVAISGLTTTDSVTTANYLFIA